MAASQPVRLTQDRPERPSTLRRDLIFVAMGVVFLWALLNVGIKWDRLLELPESLIDFFGRKDLFGK